MNTPRVVALIPARGGSKGIPRKNVTPVGGKPLLAYSVEHALGTPEIDEVVISTDCADIARIASELGATVVDRPAELSTDECQSESALLHALDWLVARDGTDPELVVFLQATSPLRPPDATSKALAELRKSGADSLFSASPAHGFIWRDDGNDPAPVNYDPRHRLRRQESEEYLEENGSIYIFKPSILRETGARLGGKIIIHRMGLLERLQIDESGDLELARWIMERWPDEGNLKDSTSVVETSMDKTVTIGGRRVGRGWPCFVVAEIGINHNGDLDLAKRLIDAASAAKCDAVKFQKRTVEVVYTPEELDRPRENPFGPTNGDLKRSLEFGEAEYREIDAHCRKRGILWFASCWDPGSVDFMKRFDPPCYKIPSACLTDHSLLRYHRSCGKPIILSTGMSTIEQIDEAVEVLGTDDLIVLHCTSTYPASLDELNLRCVGTLVGRYPVPIGYSGHEVGLPTTVTAVALGACMVERHITLDRAMWGSDQAASVEPHGFQRLVGWIRSVENALGDGEKRVYDREIPVMEKLRRVR